VFFGLIGFDVGRLAARRLLAENAHLFSEHVVLEARVMSDLE
jgi:hypothetical protein